MQVCRDVRPWASNFCHLWLAQDVQYYLCGLNASMVELDTNLPYAIMEAR